MLDEWEGHPESRLAIYIAPTKVSDSIPKFNAMLIHLRRFAVKEL